MASITLAKFRLSQLMITLIFGIWASEPPPGLGDWKDSKTGHDRVNRWQKSFLFGPEITRKNS